MPYFYGTASAMRTISADFDLQEETEPTKATNQKDAMDCDEWADDATMEDLLNQVAAEEEAAADLNAANSVHAVDKTLPVVATPFAEKKLAVNPLMVNKAPMGGAAPVADFAAYQQPSAFNTAMMPSLEELDQIHDHASLMRIYYSRLFPYKQFTRWLSYGNNAPNVFTNREFSFTLRDPGTQAEVYLRFLSYATPEEFRQDLIKKNPEKMDIGAIYSAKPKSKNTIRPGLFRPLERELIFDIDMTDYDAVRTCCKGADICEKCWKFMTISIRILDYALTENFGFKNLFWVYSGRRGVHCWVCDEKARKLSEDARKAIVNYLEVIKGGEQKAKKVFLSPTLHPFLEHSADILKEYFETVVLKEQDILSNAEMEAKMLELIPSQAVREEIATQWSMLKSSKDKWRALTEIIDDEKQQNKSLRMTVLEIMFQYLYPRLDAQVSMHLNHLLKSPFCVHPKTGRVCVPIRARDCQKFNPMDVPTVMDLCRQINQYDKKHPDQVDAEGKRIPDWKKTKMTKYIAMFDEFIQELQESIRSAKAKQQALQDQKMEF